MSKPCRYCGKEITWDKEKIVYINPDGSKHDCRTQKIDQPKPFDFETAIRAIVRDELKRVKG